MADTAKTTGAGAGSTASADVQAEFDALRHDVSKLTDAVTRLLGESAEEARTRARERVHQTATAAQEAASAAGHRVSDFVEEKPATSLLIAFGIGLLFGSFFRRS